MPASTIELDLALLDCVKRGDPEAVQSLLAVGADANAVDALTGLPAVGLAAQQGHQALVRLLVLAGAPPPAAEQDTTHPGYSFPDVPADWACLAAWYRQCGYIRRPRGQREEGWELRFLIQRKRDLPELQRLLAQGGFPIDPPERRFGSHLLIVAGRQAVERFLTLLRTLTASCSPG